jgi:hypothetical protein
MFDLERAIHAWRRQMAAGGVHPAEALDELESHLRDDVAEQVRSGADAEPAFAAAVRRLGPAWALREEFTKAERAPLRRRQRRFVQGVCFVSAAGVLLINTWTLIEYDLGAAERVVGLCAVVFVALYLASVPFLPGLLSRAAWVRYMATVKVASLLLALVPVWALLTAFGIIRFEAGLLPSMAVWLLYAAAAISLFPCAVRGDTGQEGGSGASMPPSNPGPQTIPPSRPVPPEIDIPLPPSMALAPIARESLESARQEARRLGHDFVGTEHVLLGVLESATGSLGAVLQNRGLDREALRREIERLVAPLPPRATPTGLPFTPRARKALRLAGSEAKRLKRPVIGAEHLLLGLLREGSGVAAQALKNLGFRLQPLRVEISEG